MPPNSPPPFPNNTNKGSPFFEDIPKAFYSTISAESLIEISAHDITGGLSKPLSNQLYTDPPAPRVLCSPDPFLRHQQLRIARSSTLFNRRFQKSGVLFCPLVTVGCVSICRSHLQPLLQPTVSPQQPELSLDRMVFACGFCTASIPLADVLSRIAHPENAQCTAELLELLASEHAVDCRGRNAAQQLYEEDAMFGISESSSLQNASASHLNRT